MRDSTQLLFITQIFLKFIGFEEETEPVHLILTEETEQYAGRHR